MVTARKKFLSIGIGREFSLSPCLPCPFNLWYSTLNLARLNVESLKIILLLLIVATVCAALHWMVGLAQRRLVRRFGLDTEPDGDASFSFKGLLINWAGNALRTLIWVLYFA